MDKRRIKIENTTDKKGNVAYWMSRDQRAEDNWALIKASEIANQQQTGLAVIFCLADNFLGATHRQYDFMKKGLEETERRLKELNIPFYVLKGDPPKKLAEFINQYNINTVITDFDPLKIKREWQDQLKSLTDTNFIIVDAHNIVPCFYASPKQEFAAYTLRPKINKILHEFLTEFPDLKAHPCNWPFKLPTNNWDEILESINIDYSVKPIHWLQPGTKAGNEVLKTFIQNKLENYAEQKNDPNNEALSNLSPYIHFGQLSAQRIAIEVSKTEMKGKESFLEELIVRRELADNYCYYNKNYDNTKGFPEWAKKTLEEHHNDFRQYIYSLEEFEKAQTHDPLWNASQIEMVKTGKMHGYMRMYWAKKILEWSENVTTAQKICIYLNDKYELDGRDPNGYTGINWSIGGVHDRAWGSRNIFGKIRYMSYNGCKSKFKIQNYIDKIKNL